MRRTRRRPPWRVAVVAMLALVAPLVVGVAPAAHAQSRTTTVTLVMNVTNAVYRVDRIVGTATITPAQKGRTVVLEGKLGKGAWKTMAAARTDAYGVARLVAGFPAVGTWTWHAKVLPPSPSGKPSKSSSPDHSHVWKNSRGGDKHDDAALQLAYLFCVNIARWMEAPGKIGDISGQKLLGAVSEAVGGVYKESQCDGKPFRAAVLDAVLSGLAKALLERGLDKAFAPLVKMLERNLGDVVGKFADIAVDIFNAWVLRAIKQILAAEVPCVRAARTPAATRACTDGVPAMIAALEDTLLRS
jgi:hypothetical protein